MKRGRRHNILPGLGTCRGSALGQKTDDVADMRLVEGIIGHEERVGFLAGDIGQYPVEIGGQCVQPEAEARYPVQAPSPSAVENGRVGCVVGVPQESNPVDVSGSSRARAEAFGDEVWAQDRVAVTLPPGRARLARGRPPTGSPTEDRHDRDARCRLLAAVRPGAEGGIRSTPSSTRDSRRHRVVRVASRGAILERDAVARNGILTGEARARNGSQSGANRR